MRSLDLVLNALEQLMPTSVDTSWIVLTGAPSAGKSTVLQELSRRGHRVLPEQARLFLDAQMATGRTIADISADPGQMAREIFAKNLAAQAATPVDQVMVFDRALPDVLAFTLVDGVDSEPFVSGCARHRFATALVFEHIPDTSDRATYHSRSEIAAITTACEAIYRTMATRVHRVPFLTGSQHESIAQRVALVERELQRVLSVTHSSHPGQT